MYNTCTASFKDSLINRYIFYKVERGEKKIYLIPLDQLETQNYRI